MPSPTITASEAADGLTAAIRLVGSDAWAAMDHAARDATAATVFARMAANIPVADPPAGEVGWANAVHQVRGHIAHRGPASDAAHALALEAADRDDLRAVAAHADHRILADRAGRTVDRLLRDPTATTPDWTPPAPAVRAITRIFDGDGFPDTMETDLAAVVWMAARAGGTSPPAAHVAAMGIALVAGDMVDRDMAHRLARVAARIGVDPGPAVAAAADRLAADGCPTASVTAIARTAVACRWPTEPFAAAFHDALGADRVDHVRVQWGDEGITLLLDGIAAGIRGLDPDHLRRIPDTVAAFGENPGALRLLAAASACHHPSSSDGGTLSSARLGIVQGQAVNL